MVMTGGEGETSLLLTGPSEASVLTDRHGMATVSQSRRGCRRLSDHTQAQYSNKHCAGMYLQAQCDILTWGNCALKGMLHAMAVLAATAHGARATLPQLLPRHTQTGSEPPGRAAPARVSPEI